LIPGIARDLMPDVADWPARRLRAQTGGRRQPLKRELRDLSGEREKRSGDVINRLSKTAHDALNFRPKALQHLRGADGAATPWSTVEPEGSRHDCLKSGMRHIAPRVARIVRRHADFRRSRPTCGRSQRAP